jgi:hypothetical protein
MKTWIRIPIWVDENNFDPYTKAILLRLFNKSFYNNGEYSQVQCSASGLSRDLGISRPSVIKKLNYLHDNGFIERDRDIIKLKETNKCKPNLQVSNEFTPSVNEVYSKCKNGLQGVSISFTPCPVYDRLTEGFESLLVFKQYYYSISSVDVDDMIKIIENIHNLEVFQMARKQYHSDQSLKQFEQNKKFKSCLEWIREIYQNDDQNDGIPVDRYLLYVLLEAIQTAKNPQGRFIVAVEMLRKDGKRLNIDLSEATAIERRQRELSNIEMRQEKTLRLIETHSENTVSPEEAEKKLQKTLDLIKASS